MFSESPFPFLFLKDYFLKCFFEKVFKICFGSWIILNCCFAFRVKCCWLNVYSDYMFCNVRCCFHISPNVFITMFFSRPNFYKTLLFLIKFSTSKFLDIETTATVLKNVIKTTLIEITISKSQISDSQNMLSKRKKIKNTKTYLRICLIIY